MGDQIREVERGPAPDRLHDQVKGVGQAARENEQLLRGSGPMCRRAGQRLRPKLTSPRLQRLTGSGQLHGDFVEHVRNAPVLPRRPKGAPRRESLRRFNNAAGCLDQPQ